MSKLLTSILIFFTGIGALYAIYSNTRTVFTNPIVERIIPQSSNTRSIVPQTTEQKYMFVPYWTYDQNFVTDSEYSLIYFGLGVNSNGIEKSDNGFKKLSSFVALSPNAIEHILAIRMIDASINSQILKDKELQEKIINDSINYALENNFESVLLDFETSAFAFDSTINNISDFYTLFSSRVNETNLNFYVTLFGDNYFRTRAYDAKKIGELSDKVFVMTYDFHKSRGNPGPNFPLKDNGQYGYDLSKMVDEFQKDIENEKLVIVLGYFGYDWRIGNDQKSVTSGVPLSTNEIEQDFIDSCGYKNCNLIRDNITNEPSILYADDSNNSHVIWYEDEESISKKIEFLKSKGILEIGYWAYSYF